MLELANISKSFAGNRTIDDVSLTVTQGEVLGIIGPNGAGKTTLFNLMSGFLPVDSGRIRFMGQDITGWRPDQIGRAGLARTFQITESMDELTVQESVMLGAFAIHTRRRHALALASEILEFTAMDRLKGTKAVDLTAAERHRLDFAKALAMRPKLILLDEITAGMWPEEQEQIAELIRQSRHDLGVTFVVIEHKLSFLCGVAERAIALTFGRTIAEGPPRDVLATPAVEAAYLGTSTSHA
jgi:branched-chain amino acid transport system ATP-binding protein